MIGDDSEPTTIEECAAALYRASYDLARVWLEQGRHPDAVRFAFRMIDVRFPSTWRAVEDAIAGRAPAP